jgi:hypothetical protein
MKPKYILNIFGGGLMLLGVLGFFQKSVFGLFDFSVWHNLLYVFSGILALVGGGESLGRMRSYAKWLGMLYGFLSIFALAIGPRSAFNFVVFNAAGQILHMTLAAGFLVSAFGYNPRGNLGFQFAPIKKPKTS